MSTMRNPFRLRASEQATSDEDFLALFGPKVLDILPVDEMWDRLLIMASAPGAGKTTLLRLFTPGVLRMLNETRQVRENRELVLTLEALGVLGPSGPNVLGVHIDCREQYAFIEDLPLEQAARLSSFFELLDARIILLTIKAALTIGGMAYPRDVSYLKLRPRSDDGSNASVDHVDGKKLYEEASSTEDKIINALDSLRGVPQLPAERSARLQSLRLLSNSDILVRGIPVASRILIMFDDVQALDGMQRKTLRSDLEDRTLRVARWMAERHEAVAPPELPSTARTEGRDFRYTRQFEEWARSPAFEKMVLDIGNRRSRRAEVSFQEFASCLAEEIAHGFDQKRIQEALEGSQRLAHQLAGSRSRFIKWLQAMAGKPLSPYENAVRWRALAILIHRDLGRQQLSFDFPLESDELERRTVSSIDAAAALFLAREYRLPYYFGSRCLALLASNNIEQFLEFAGDLFDKVIGSSTLALKARQLTASQQDAIVREISRRRLLTLARDLPHGVDIHRLVGSIGSLCHEETYRPSAPYAPGATGIAISMRERDVLCNPSIRSSDGRIDRLYYALASAVAHNILEARPDVRFKGQNWLVLYLNRGLCPAFELPLQYGGIRERPLSDLKRWLDEEYRPRRQTRMELDR